MQLAPWSSGIWCSSCTHTESLVSAPKRGRGSGRSAAMDSRQGTCLRGAKNGSKPITRRHAHPPTPSSTTPFAPRSSESPTQRSKGVPPIRSLPRGFLRAPTTVPSARCGQRPEAECRLRASLEGERDLADGVTVQAVEVGVLEGILGGNARVRRVGELVSADGCASVCGCAGDGV